MTTSDGLRASIALSYGATVPLIACAAAIAILATLMRAEWTTIGIALAALVTRYPVLHQLRVRH